MPAEMREPGPAEKRRCHRCGALLRRTNDGDLCSPCTRRRGRAEPSLPADFYADPNVVAALTNHDFGPFFKAARSALDMTQDQFGVLVGLEQGRVCKIENNAVRLRD